MDKSMIREALNNAKIDNGDRIREADYRMRKFYEQREAECIMALAELDKPGEGDPDAHLSDEDYLKAKQDRFAKGGLANVDPDKYMEEVRGTGMVLTDGEIERIAQERVGPLADTESGRLIANTCREFYRDALRYARDNGYLSAPAKAPAEVVEAGNEVIRCYRAFHEAIAHDTGKPYPWEPIESAIDRWDAALKSTNTTERRPGECDYRKRECVNDGKTVNGVWVCNNHLSNTPEHGN